MFLLQLPNASQEDVPGRTRPPLASPQSVLLALLLYTEQLTGENTDATGRGHAEVDRRTTQVEEAELRPKKQVCAVHRRDFTCNQFLPLPPK